MFTIMIAARNAAETIERAIVSCIGENADVLLIDDHSTDDTVARAKHIAGKSLHVVQAQEPGGVPMARQTGLDAVYTPYAAWLDADDEWVPGRVDRLLCALQHGFDVVTDSIDLYDGQKENFLRRLEVPSFLRQKSIPVRLFERNYLPGDTQVGFRTELFRVVGGYDPHIYGSESYDILLRAVSRGTEFAYLCESGYRMHAYSKSLSRDLPLIRSATALALKKHHYEKVRNMCIAAGYDNRIAAWVLVSMAIYREEFGAALDYLEQASPANVNPDVIIEPDGPLPLPEGWRRAFFRGTLLLLLREDNQAAGDELRKAETFYPTAEGANNLGIAKRRLGLKSDAMQLFATALNRFPGYFDAKLNMIEENKDHITTHPFRRHASRSEYKADLLLK